MESKSLRSPYEAQGRDQSIEEVSRCISLHIFLVGRAHSSCFLTRSCPNCAYEQCNQGWAGCNSRFEGNNLGCWGRIWHRLRLSLQSLLWCHICQQSLSWLSGNRSARSQSYGLQTDRPRRRPLFHFSSCGIPLSHRTPRCLQLP